MRVNRREFLKGTMPLGYALSNPELERLISPIDLTYAEPAPKELMQRYLELFSLIKQRNEGLERYRAQKTHSSLDMELENISGRNAIINLNQNGRSYYAAKLNDDLYFGNGFQFTIRNSQDNAKDAWILTPEFAINRFGRLNQEFSYSSLPYMDLLRKLHSPGLLPDLYARSRDFAQEFKGFLKALERYA
jgi:hypothetical protein